MKRLVCFLAIAFAACGGSASSSDLARWQQQAANVTIIRDNWGIPHVYGKSDADAVFGLLYAQAEDDFNRVEVNYINAMGRMAEVEGKEALYGDLRMQLFIDSTVVKQEYVASPDSLKALMNAFADGLNYFLHTHPEVKPKLITRFEPWMALTFSEGSIGGDIESISLRNLEAFYGDKQAAMVANVDANPDLEPRGSNGIAIAATNTSAGHPLFLINPHTSFYFRPEVHMVSEAGLNAYGAVTWGQFFVYQGFNEYNGWMHTSTAADVIDEYAETVEKKGEEYFYKYGSELKPFMVRTLRLPYKDGATLAHREFRVYVSEHGPVIRADQDKWITIKLMVAHEKALSQSFLRTKTTGLADFKRVMELRTNSSNNTVYASAEGDIAYFHGNFMPKRDTSFSWSGVVDGSNPATEWKGLHSVDEMIVIHNPSTGWIQNTNSTPFTASGSASPRRDQYPSYMAPDEENARGLHAVRVLKDRKDFTLESLIVAAYDPYLTGFDALIPALLANYDQLAATDALKAPLKGAVDSLRSWDRKTGVASVPTTLAVYWGQELMRRARADEYYESGPVFDYMAGKMSAAERLGALQAAVAQLDSSFGTWKTPWGEVNRFQRVTGDIVQPFDDSKPSLPVGFASGTWGSLASFGARIYPGTKKMYGTSGNSFVAVVEFGPRVRAKSILAGGESGDPASPHFYDQAKMYSEGAFKDVRFYREDVEAHAKRTYHPGDAEADAR
ncbi:MAG: penicillin acylase family protein [Gemmatimonadaceae bacterium]